MQIEKGIPMPVKKTVGAIDAMVVQMEIGDSVLTDYKPSGATSVFTLAARRKKLPYTFNSRPVGDKTRVWRVA